MADYYPPAEAEQTAETAEHAPESAEAKTYLVSKSLFGGEPKVGDTAQVKVVAIYDDEVEVAKAETSETKPLPSPDEQLDAMATEES